LTFTKYFFWDVPDDWPEGVYPLCNEPIDVYFLNCTSHWVLVETIYTADGMITVNGVPGYYRFEWVGAGECEWQSQSYYVSCRTTELPDNYVECPKEFTKYFYWNVPEWAHLGLFPLCNEKIKIYYYNCTTNWVKVDCTYTGTGPTAGMITVFGVPGTYQFKWVGTCEPHAAPECGPTCLTWWSQTYLVDCTTTTLGRNFVDAPKTFTKSFFWVVPAHWADLGVFPVCDETFEIWYLNCTTQWVKVDVELSDTNGMITVHGVPGTYKFVWPDCGLCSWTSDEYVVTCCTRVLPDNFVDVPKGGDKDYCYPCLNLCTYHYCTLSYTKHYHSPRVP
jgi:hypothetical protein